MNITTLTPTILANHRHSAVLQIVVDYRRHVRRRQKAKLSKSIWAGCEHAMMRCRLAQALVTSPTWTVVLSWCDSFHGGKFSFIPPFIQEIQRWKTDSQTVTDRRTRTTWLLIMLPAPIDGGRAQAQNWEQRITWCFCCSVVTTEKKTTK